jgi:outer membrane protein OmpA-like peptidoglycan-associated protein
VVFVMTNFPNVKIKIESHTDSRGKDAYNMKLSDNRAKSTQQYIISKGIDALRIDSAIGYGESRLVNNCKNGVKCSEEAHLKNRRSDFIIIEK